MRRRQGFTLIEVAVAGTLIGLTVAVTLAIIPSGLKAQHQARMRAVAAATVAYLFYSQNHWTPDEFPGTTTNYPFNSPIQNFQTACLDSAKGMLEPITTPSPTLMMDVAGNTGDTGLSAKYCIKLSRGLAGLNGGQSTDLTRRLVFAFSTVGSLRYMVVWECSVDPRSSKPGKLFELATFNYYDPF